MNKKNITFKFSLETIVKIKEMAKERDLSQAKLLTKLIEKEHELVQEKN